VSIKFLAYRSDAAKIRVNRVYTARDLKTTLRLESVYTNRLTFADGFVYRVDGIQNVNLPPYNLAEISVMDDASSKAIKAIRI
jgi:hypothetical protein